MEEQKFYHGPLINVIRDSASSDSIFNGQFESKSDKSIAISDSSSDKSVKKGSAMYDEGPAHWSMESAPRVKDEKLE